MRATHLAPFPFERATNVWRGRSVRKRFRSLATAADIGGGIIQPSPRCIVTPSGDCEARPRIDIQARTFRRGLTCPRVTHLCSVGRRAQEHHETHRQSRAHSISSNPATALSDALTVSPQAAPASQLREGGESARATRRRGEALGCCLSAALANIHSPFQLIFIRLLSGVFFFPGHRLRHQRRFLPHCVGTLAGPLVGQGSLGRWWI
ncbi:hypothetical protein ABIB80_007036 [Bradyrhizobium sp. i1.15.2]